MKTNKELNLRNKPTPTSHTHPQHGIRGPVSHPSHRVSVGRGGDVVVVVVVSVHVGLNTETKNNVK